MKDYFDEWRLSQYESNRLYGSDHYDDECLDDITDEDFAEEGDENV